MFSRVLCHWNLEEYECGCYNDFVVITGSRWQDFSFLTKKCCWNWTASFGSECISFCNKDQGYVSCVTGFETTCLSDLEKSYERVMVMQNIEYK